MLVPGLVVRRAAAAIFSPQMFSARWSLGLFTLAAWLVLWPAVAFAGDPSFDDRQRFGSGLDRTQSLVAVDVDDDGDLDLVVGNTGQQSAVYLNDGRGQFYDGPAGDCTSLGAVLRCFGGAAAATAGPGASALLPDALPIVAVAAGDVNGDSAPDIVAVTDSFGGQVYLNDGRGYFGQGQPFGPATARYRTLALGDVNGDARLDIVAGGVGLSLVLINQGEGAFHAGPVGDCASPPAGVICLDTTATAATLALAPLDAGPSLDIVVGTNQADGTGGQGVVYLNDGAGRFEVGAPGTCTSNVSPRLPAIVCLGLAEPGAVWQRVVVGDLDSQSGFDIVASFRAAPERVFFALPQGGFAGATDLATGVTPLPGLPEPRNLEEEAGPGSTLARPLELAALVEGGLALADVDGNGLLDVISGRYGGQNGVYLGNAGGDRRMAPFGAGTDATTTVVVADLDDDGDLDLAAGNWEERSAVYLNDGSGAFPAPAAIPGGQPVYGLATGDIDLDGDLDLVAAHRGGQGVFVHLNAGSGVFSGTFPIVAGRPSSLVLGDLNGDRYLDLLVGFPTSPLSVYFYAPEVGRFGAGQPFGRQGAQGVALGDLNGDGFLDVIVGYLIGGNVAYLNNGAGNFSLQENERRLGHASFTTTSIAVGDLDGDSDLDVVAGNGGGRSERSALYLNDGAGNFNGKDAEHLLPGDAANTNGIALGDLDGDGDLDIVAGNGGSAGRESTAFLNDGNAGFAAPRVVGNSAFRIDGIHLVDIDGDGDIDVVAVRRGEEDAVYVNDGRANFPTLRTFGAASVGRKYLAAGDIDSDGDIDLISAGSEPFTVIFNRWRQSAGLPSQPGAISIARPDGAGAAPLHATSVVLRDTVIPFTYRLFDPGGRAVRRVEASYSPGAGRQWEPALPTPETVTRTLATSPSAGLIGASHIFGWDTFASKLFDRSDRVVLRLKAFPSHQPTPNGLPEAGLWPYVSSAVGLLRVVGTQVQVVDDAGGEDKPLAGAFVFRLRAGETSGGEPLANEAGEPLQTNAMGYLQGRAQTGLGDRLVALWPVTQTYSYTLYYTSAPPNRTGLSMHEVTGPGLQRLVVSKASPLVLFNLDISLEWDARNDGTFLDDLEQAIIRSSETLYDVGDGQMALGNVRIFQAGDNWTNADTVIYASSGIRPRATLGGVVSQPTDDVINATRVITDAFWPGQIRMGPAWDPFGESRADLTTDWSRALAHEYGHHFLYLPDNYLGYDDNGYIVGVDCRGSFMTNTYEDSYSEFLTPSEWSPSAACARSIAARLTGRSDWQTISQYYDMLSPRQNLGPSSLPIEVTRIWWMDPATPSTALPSRNYDLRSGDGARLSLLQGQAYLVQRYGTRSLADDRIVALGPIVRSDRVRVRGAREADRVCVYDDSRQPPLWGCEQVRSWSSSVTLRELPGWRPSLQIAPVALPAPSAPSPATRLPVTITGEITGPVDLFTPGIAITVTFEQPLASTQQLSAQVFSSYDPAGGDPTGAMYVQLASADPANSSVFSGMIPLKVRAPSGFVRVWVPGITDEQVLRESISQFFLTEDWGRPDLAGAWIESQPTQHQADARGQIVSRPGFGVPWRPGFGAAGRPGFGTADRPGFGTADRPGFGTADRPGFGTADRPGFGTADRPGFGTADRPGFGADARAWGANRRALGAPMGSSDGQVTIFNRSNVLDDTGVLSLEALAVIPGLPEWLTPVGRGYRFIANSAAPRSIVFNYLQREAPPGYEHALTLYTSPDEGRSWQALVTGLDAEENTATASAADSGLYVLAASVDLPFYTNGWNLFAYPLPGSRPVTEALKSIDGYYVTVFTYDDFDSGNPWRVYDPAAPAWVSDLSRLEYGRGYWINIRGPVTPTLDQPLLLRLKAPLTAGDEDAHTSSQPGPVDARGRRNPPAVYYGSVEPAPNVAAGAAVAALVNGVTCGVGTVTAGEASWKLHYVLKVPAAEPGVKGVCGVPGAQVVFTLGAHEAGTSQAWDNRGPIRLDLALR